MKSTNKIKLRKYQLQRQDRRRIEVMTEEQINMIKELLRKKDENIPTNTRGVYDPNIFKAVFLAGGKGVW